VLAQRFDRTVSWVSRRLSLVRTLPEAIQQHVHDGHLVAHAAMKYLVPLARANAGDCLRFTEANHAASADHPANRAAVSALRRRA
jgi:ParB family transcriptional regulator, chromosome partitioning protein